MLQRIAACIQTLARSEDLPARVGGDELVVLLPGSDQQGAVGFGERIRAAVSALQVHEHIALSVSVGVATFDDCTDGDMLLRRADEALYAAKAAGRDCVATV